MNSMSKLFGSVNRLPPPLFHLASSSDLMSEPLPLDGFLLCFDIDILPFTACNKGDKRVGPCLTGLARDGFFLFLGP